ncbi:MAG: RIP metalloprotease RseP [Polyangiaceae bacterium]|nr:RIP metalloprotease RseP [Polyangiaceae bacterium]
MDLIYFIILVSSLIFVHELGHFVAAKMCGVKVLTFSLGFGPKIVRIRGKETEYCIGVFPLGGFVKMLEANRNEPVLPEDTQRTLEAQPMWQRFLIVIAGPVMNLVFPVLLYFVAYMGDTHFLPPTVGIVLPDHPAYGVLEPGDRIMEVNEQRITTYAELNRMVRSNPGVPLRMKVFRDLSYVDVSITPKPVVESRELDTFETVGRIGIKPGAPAAAIGVSDPKSPAFRSGLRTFDLVIQAGDRPIERFIELERAFDSNRGETVPVAYLRPKAVEGAFGGLLDFAVYEHGVAALMPAPDPGELYARTGIESSDLFVAVVPSGSAESKADLRAGDKIIELDGKPLLTWHSFRERIEADPETPHLITWLRDGRRLSGTVQVRREDWVDDYGALRSSFVIRAQNWLPIASEALVENPSRIKWAATNAIEETRHVLRFISVSIVRLVQGKLSLSTLSGPLEIYQVAGEEGAKGADYFLWVMALVSINLGLINLLPIPVLDGGHMLFFATEAVIRRPLPMRVREVASLMGMLFLIAIMGIAFKNDVDRRWDIIVGQLKELF